MPEVFVPRNIKCPSAVERRNSLPERPALTRSSSPSKRHFRRHRTFANKRRRLPNFTFEYADGRQTDTGIRRNWNTLDAVEIVPNTVG